MHHLKNFQDKAASDPDYRVTVDDLQSWERAYGRIPDGAVVIMNSGWTTRYPNRTQTFNTDTPDDPKTFHFPGWHEDAATWLVNNRNINVIGVDTPSNDYGMSTSFPVHVITSANNMTGLENVANLDAIPEAGTVITVAVMKLEGGSGGPARVFATMNSDTYTSTSSVSTLSRLLSFLLIIVCYV